LISGLFTPEYGGQIVRLTLFSIYCRSYECVQLCLHSPYVFTEG
jgi:hypothetical protein